MKDVDFRAWDPVAKKMSYDVTLYANGWVECVFPDGEEKKYPPGQIELLPYIGIKGTNKKKCYKGDIVRVKQVLFTDCSRLEVERIRNFVGKIIWWKHGWCIERY